MGAERITENGQGRLEISSFEMSVNKENQDIHFVQQCERHLSCFASFWVVRLTEVVPNGSYTLSLVN